MSNIPLTWSRVEASLAQGGKKKRKVLRILWPAHCQETTGWLIGWVRSDCLSVATVIEDAEIRLGTETRAGRSGSLETPPSSERLHTSWSGRLDMGSEEADEDGSEMLDPIRAPKTLVQKVELLNQDFAKAYWMTDLQILGFFDPTNSVLRRVRGYGFGTVTTNTGTRPQLFSVDGRSDLVPPQQVVLYDQPKQNQMYCDMFEWKKVKSKETVPKIVTNSESSSTHTASLHQINTSRSVEWILKAEKSPLAKELTRDAAMRAFAMNHSHYQPLLWHISRVQVALLTSVMWLLVAIHWILNRRLPVLGRLAEYGLMGGFLDKRLVILLNFRDQVERLKTIPYTWQNDPGVQRAWLRFYNTSFSMLVDSALGMLAAYMLWRILSPLGFSHAQITSHMTTLWGYEWLKQQIKWIMVGAPAGLKLNLAPVQALGSIFLFYIEQWSIIVRQLAEAAPVVLVLITLTGAFFGLSMMIILVHDVVYFVNMHIYWLYAAITRVYHTQLVLLRSLWLLFRGKKSNVLKQRIDSCNASLDQLVLGTLLFTSLIFLLPTTAMYYMFFVYAMCIVLLLQAVAQLVVAILHYSPLYATLLYVTGSRLLTGGISFQLLDSPTRLATSTSTTSLVMLAEQAVASAAPSTGGNTGSGTKSPGSLSSSSSTISTMSAAGNRRVFVSYFRLCATGTSFSVLLGDFNKALAVIGANYQLKKLIDCFLFGSTWQNRRFQPNRLKNPVLLRAQEGSDVPAAKPS